MFAGGKWEFISIKDYLDGELVSPVKHEYRDGVVYAMAGARNVHNRISVNALASLFSQLRGKPCTPWNSDTKIRVSQRSGVRFYYPDVSVVCRPNPEGDTWQDEPVVILEVVSASTRRIDLGEKKDAYLTIPSMSVYLVAESSEMAVQVFRRSQDGEFVRELAIGPEAVIDLPEVGATLSLADLYEGVEFEKEEEVV